MNKKLGELVGSIALNSTKSSWAPAVPGERRG